MAALGREDMSLEEPRLPLARLFDTANAKVLDFLLGNEGLMYTYNDISRLAAVPKRSLRRSLHTLLDEKVIIRMKKKGSRTFYYTADLSSQRTTDLIKYIDSTLLCNLDVLKKHHGAGQR